MIPIHPRKTAAVAIDMHRGHLDPAVATLPLPAESCARVIRATRELFTGLRERRVPIVHVITVYRDSGEAACNPFWNAIAGDPQMKRGPNLRHNLAGMPGTEIIPELLDPRDLVVDTKKRYDCFYGTELDFVLRHRLGAEALIITGVNTNSCVLCTSFEAQVRDYAVVVAADCVDTMDGEQMHRFALQNLAAAVGWVRGNDEILAALDEHRRESTQRPAGATG